MIALTPVSVVERVSGLVSVKSRERRGRGPPLHVPPAQGCHNKLSPQTIQRIETIVPTLANISIKKILIGKINLGINIGKQTF